MTLNATRHLQNLTDITALLRMPEVAGRGTVVVMPAWWQARISAPLK